MTLQERIPDTLFVTAPPDEGEELPPLTRWKRRAVAKASAAILPIVKKVARPYIGGDTVAEAMSVAERLSSEGFASTLGYWDAGTDSARAVAEIYRDAIGRLSTQDRGGYVSMKPPALRFSANLSDALARAAAPLGVRLHLDSHGVEVADASNAMLELMAANLSGEMLGTTLPGRWRRSLTDADWAVERAFNVRVVKGQWSEPDDPRRDPSGGFLKVIDRLAGRARHVAVATHDFPLACEAIHRLRAAGTPCGVEVLLGMPARPLIRWAKENGVGVRVYVPFGAGFIPNALGVLKRNPRIAVAVAKEYVTMAGEGVARVFNARR